MSTQFDIERLLVNLGTLISSNLNTYISAINTEKNDSITLRTVDFTRQSLFLQSIDDIVNADPFILYGLSDDFSVESAGGTAAKELAIEICLVMADSQNDANIHKRLYRYQRALMDFLNANWSEVSLDTNRIRMVGRQPTPAFQMFDNANYSRAIGVAFKTTLV